MNFKKYHVSRNLCPIANFYKTTDLYYSILFETPLPAGTYTISAEITSTSTESRISFRKNNMSQIIASNITIQTGRSQLTFTISEPCYALYIYGSTTVFDNIPIKFENIMLNTGSTPQPYEPYSSEVWHDIPYYAHKTATDTLTTLPAVLYPNDTTATVGLKGQTLQSSTPSPTSPVMPNGTGERTGNLLDSSITRYEKAYSDRIVDFSGGAMYIVPIKRNTTYTAKTYSDESIPVFRIGLYNKPVPESGDTVENIVGKSGSNPTATITNTDYKYLMIQISGSYIDEYGLAGTVLNESSTALPYEPYGYKIPISCGGTTNNVYLGEVQTERKIKKLVLTGQEEGWIKQDSLTATDAYQNYNLTSNYLRTEYIVTHMPVNSSIADTSTHGYIGQRITLCMNKALSLSTVDLFKIWLADEYSAGHPVILYYVSSTPQTGVVNEPLQKIGTYADSLTTSISCTAGENTLDVQTTVAPSEVTAGFSGWHPVQSVHERENGQWD